MSIEKSVSDGLHEARPGHRLYVRRLRIGSGQKLCQLVLVHGICATEAFFLPMLEDLAGSAVNLTLDCILYDQIGCGKSPPVIDWSAYAAASAAQDLQALIESTCVANQPLVLLGHSYASATMLPAMTALRDRYRIIGCIFLASAVRTPSLAIADGGHPVMRLPTSILQCLQPALTQGFVAAAVGDDKQVQQLATEHSNANDMKVAKAYHRQMTWPTTAALTTAVADCPVLVLQGADDGVIGVSAGQELANLCGGRLVVIDHVKHLLMLEAPEQCAAAIGDFLHKLL